MGHSAIGGMAVEAMRLVLTDPVSASRLAETARNRAASMQDHATVSVAERVLGLAARELGQIDRAVAHVGRSIRLADKHGLDELSTQSRVEMAWLMAYRGDTSAAMAQIDSLSKIVKGANAARLQMANAHVLTLMGRLEEAVECNKRALRAFRRGSDRLWEAMSLNNRGLVYTELGNLRRAESDLKAAQTLYEQMGNTLGVADVWWNRGFVASRNGDFPAALKLYAQADELYRRQAVPKPHLLLDRCELYLSARLIPEAREAALRAIEQLSASRRSLELADATLMASLSALMAGDAATAKAMASKAERSFARQQRPGWLALSRYAGVRARWMAGEGTASSLDLALKTAAELAGVGWAVPALDTCVLASQIAMGLGKMDIARKELGRASRARGYGTVEVRTRAWHATALLRLSDNNRRGAYSALRAGMNILDQHRASLGATELRAYASGHGTELAQLGLRMALEDHSTRQAFEWMERWRAGALRLTPVRPPADAQQAAEFAELRRIRSELDEAALSGRNSRELLHRQAELEINIREHHWAATGAFRQPKAIRKSHEVEGALGEHALLELAEVDGTIWALVMVGHKLRLHRLATTESLLPEIHALRFAARRLAWGGPDRALDAARRSLIRSAVRIEELLLKPLLPQISGRPLVIVPTGALYAIPWSMLPSLSTRPLSIAPSAALWAKAAAGSAPADGPVVLVAGPGLSGAVEEVRSIGKIYREATTLTGNGARVENVLKHLDGAALAHLATHAQFRADNPLFSCLQLSDGPLMAYDLECLSKAPRTVILSACESGLSGVMPGDELMGLASCLFSLGTSALIASVMPVPDDATKMLMTRFHDALKATNSAASALAAAQTAARLDDPDNPFAGAGFLCLGAG